MIDTIDLVNTDGESMLVLKPFEFDGPINPHTDEVQDYPNGVAISDKALTSLTFFGKGISNYGKGIQQNLLYLLENFASGEPPVKPLVGQLWYDTVNDTLKVYNKQGDWFDIIHSNVITDHYFNGKLYIIDDTVSEPDYAEVASQNYVNNAVAEYVDAQLDNFAQLSINDTGQIDLNTNNSTSSIQLPYTSIYFMNGNLVVSQYGDTKNISIDIPISITPSEFGFDVAVANMPQFNVDLSNVKTKQQPPQISQTILVSTGQDTFTVPAYVMGANSLWVFINGQKQYHTIQYNEIDSTTIKFNGIVPNGAVIEVMIFS